uniref:Transposable element P transposase-like RNase H domain-containing protein n=1 Tax=Magallana gigas TaxID=29159 RepID=A0A8W8M802_MAGGI
MRVSKFLENVDKITKCAGIKDSPDVTIKSETASVADDVGEGLFATLQSYKSGNALMDLFWEKQKKAFTTSPKGMRWHPMMIRFAIYLRCQSSRAYESLRESGVLRLPNQATLRDYTNFIQPKSGFHAEAFQELKKVAKDLSSEKKNVCLLRDEMKVKSDLVYDRRSEQVIRFTNPETWTFDEDETKRIATHVLVFMVIGIISNIKISIGHFPTRSSTADELFLLLWKAVAYIEITCGLKFLRGEFLDYFSNWQASVTTRPGFTKQKRNKMVLSHQTIEGIVMKDPLEEHFGRHRGQGARNDNPTINQFSYQENQLRLQRSLAMTINPKGNTAGRTGEKRQPTVSESPIKNIKRH